MRARRDVLLTELGDGQGVLLHLGTKFYYTLNPTGVAVWKALDQGATRAALAEKISLQFQIDAETAERDLAPVLDEMLAEGLVQAA